MERKRYRVMINPSCQYGNVIRSESGEEIYNEGKVMWDVAVRVKAIFDREVPWVEAFLSRAARCAPSALRDESALTNRLGCDLLVALHSDATGEPIDPTKGGTWTFYATEAERPLAESVHHAVLARTRSVYPEVEDRGVRTHWHRLHMLWETECPACLTEILFHTNPRERALLLDPAYQELVARGFVEGIVQYLENRHGGEDLPHREHPLEDPA